MTNAQRDKEEGFSGDVTLKEVLVAAGVGGAVGVIAYPIIVTYMIIRNRGTGNEIFEYAKEYPVNRTEYGYRIIIANQE
ncbi:hypothetical protein ACFLQJ_00535 [Calditrichota bacterium]